MRRDQIATLLPDSYQGALRPGNPLDAVLATMDALHAPAEACLDNLDAQIDPVRAGDPFVFMLAGWLGLGDYIDWASGRPGGSLPSFATGTGRLRLLVSEAAQLRRERGTRPALERFLTVATGAEGITVEDSGPDWPAFHLMISVPPPAHRHQRLIDRIVATERPAYTTYEICLRD